MSPTWFLANFPSRDFSGSRSRMAGVQHSCDTAILRLPYRFLFSHTRSLHSNPAVFVLYFRFFVVDFLCKAIAYHRTTVVELTSRQLNSWIQPEQRLF